MSKQLLDARSRPPQSAYPRIGAHAPLEADAWPDAHSPPDAPLALPICQPDPADPLGLNGLDLRLAEMAASVGPLRRVLAAIAARLIATKAWERLCYARLADYARERPGCSARQLQELARVHRALGELPELERALPQAARGRPHKTRPYSATGEDRDE